MVMVQLSNEQKVRIKEYTLGFKQFLKSKTGMDWGKEREERGSLFKKILGLENIDNLSEDQFRLVMKSLWATGFWTNKDYPINKILEDNGISKIRQELKKLLYDSDSIGKRFDVFRSNVKGVGPSSITEILVFMCPEKCCLWNEKPKNVLPFLGMENYLPSRVYRYSINGSDYEKCIDVLGLIRDEMSLNGIENPDFIDVDFFLAYLFYEVIPKTEKPSVPSKETPLEATITKIESHEQAEGILLESGNLLGFDTYTADPAKEYNGKKLSE